MSDEAFVICVAHVYMGSWMGINDGKEVRTAASTSGTESVAGTANTGKSEEVKIATMTNSVDRYTEFKKKVRQVRNGAFNKKWESALLDTNYNLDIGKKKEKKNDEEVVESENTMPEDKSGLDDMYACMQLVDWDTKGASDSVIDVSSVPATQV